MSRKCPRLISLSIRALYNSRGPDFTVWELILPKSGEIPEMERVETSLRNQISRIQSLAVKTGESKVYQ
jgi:hypothetical protein